MPHEVSHGRGGAGNINADPTEYVDGGIVRQGVEGTHGDGAFSTGRGGMRSPISYYLALSHCVQPRPDMTSVNASTTIIIYMTKSNSWSRRSATKSRPVTYLAAISHICILHSLYTDVLPFLLQTTGGGNIGDVGTPAAAARADKDFIPDAAVRASLDSNHHTGRGGAANIQLAGTGANPNHDPKTKVTDGHPEAAPGGATQHISLADKLKHKMFGKK